MDIKEILNSIELTDDQVKALDHFFEEYSQQISAKAIQAYVESNGNVDSSVVEELKKQVELHKTAFELFERDVDKAFEIFEEHADRAFAKFEEDVEKAFVLYEEDLQNDFTSKMVEALDSLYGNLREKAQQDFFESSEYAAFKQITEIVMPYVEGANAELKARLVDLEASIISEKQKNEELSRKTMIDEFVSGIPEKHSAKAKAFLEEASTEDEILQRYDLFLAFLEDYVEEQPEPSKAKQKEETSPRKRPDHLEKRKVYLEGKLEEDEEKEETAIFESETKEKAPDKKEDARLSAFKPVHKGLLQAAGLIPN